jgi:hypothetical protein
MQEGRGKTISGPSCGNYRSPSRTLPAPFPFPLTVQDPQKANHLCFTAWGRVLFIRPASDAYAKEGLMNECRVDRICIRGFEEEGAALDVGEAAVGVDVRKRLRKSVWRAKFSVSWYSSVVNARECPTFPGFWRILLRGLVGYSRRRCGGEIRGHINSMMSAGEKSASLYNCVQKVKVLVVFCGNLRIFRRKLFRFESFR